MAIWHGMVWPRSAKAFVMAAAMLSISAD